MKYIKLNVFGSIICLLFLNNAAARNSIAKNKEIVRYFMEDVLGKNMLKFYKSLHTEKFIGQYGKDTFNLEQDYESALDNRKGVPDLTFKVNRLVAEDDMIVVHWEAMGTNTGTNSFLPVASGKKLEVEGITIFRMRDGKIAEEWGLTNLLSALVKNGLFSSK